MKEITTQKVVGVLRKAGIPVGRGARLMVHRDRLPAAHPNGLDWHDRVAVWMCDLPVDPYLRLRVKEALRAERLEFVAIGDWFRIYGYLPAEG